MDAFGPYRKVKRLGGGENSEVYLCCDDRRQVVVKAFSIRHRKIKRKIKKCDFDFVEKMRMEFADEAVLTSRFNHSHIIEVLENGTLADGTHYFVMPHHPGDIASELWGSSLPQEKGLPIKPARAIVLVGQIYAALLEIHRHGVVHRDIKPQNVLLDKQGNAVLCDFGHALNPSAQSSPRKRDFGTPPFISPEQKANPVAVDGRADIYSLGIMAYLMLTGLRPGDDPVPPIQIDKTIDEYLSEWVMQAMDVDPKNRPGTLNI